MIFLCRYRKCSKTNGFSMVLRPCSAASFFNDFFFQKVSFRQSLGATAVGVGDKPAFARRPFERETWRLALPTNFLEEGRV